VETDGEDTGGYTGGMIALIPSVGDAQQLAVAGGDDPDEMHLTLIYLGDDLSDWDDAQRAQVMAAAQQTAATMSPVQARAFGHAQFNPDGGDDGSRDPCAVYLIGDTDQLGPARDALASTTDQDQHTPFVPHVTAGTGVNASDLSYTGPVTFDRMRVAMGDDTTDIPLGGDSSVTAAAPTAVDVGSPATILSDTGDQITVHWDALAVEGLDTGDGRYLTPGGGSTRTPPLSLLALPYANHGGQDAPAAEVFGEITTLTRRPGPEVTSKRTGEPFPDGTFVWSADATIDGTHKFADMVRKGHLRGGSVDLADLDAELIDEDTAAMSDNPRRRAVLTRYEIAAATMVPVPAFADAYCDVVGSLPAALAASALPTELWKEPVPMWRSSEVGDLVARTPGGSVKASARDKAAAKGHALPDGSLPIETADDLTNAIKRAGSAKDPVKARKFVMAQAKRLKLADKIPDNWNADGTTGDDAVTAAAVTRRPPLSWFTDPSLNGETPITITDDGHVYGHVAVWSRPHIGFNGQRIYAKPSRADYAFFNTGAVRCLDEDGTTRIAAVGHLTMGTGHADLQASYTAAARHYDHTGYAWADVAAGDDKWGVWVNGILKPGITEEQISYAYAHPPSGDWRPIDGGLEMVAALCVNTPGIPVSRARVASGEVVALVAAGALAPAPPQGGIGAMVDYDQLADRVADRILTRQQHTAELAARRTAALAATDDTTERMAAALAAIPDDDDEVSTFEAVRADTLASFLAGKEITPKDAENTARLKEYWTHGKGAALIRWGEPSDFDRCRTHLAKYVPPGGTLDGLCANMHHDALGVWPGKEHGKK
jgi:2'-5' RNA ligase